MKIYTLSLLLLLGSAASADLYGQEKAPHPRTQGPAQGQERADHRQRILDRFDLNRDGRLDHQEREAMRAARGSRHLQDGERRQDRRRGKRSGRGQARERILQKFDTDNDGRLTGAEREAFREAMKARRGGEGRQGARRGANPERRAGILKRFDTDGDGVLSEQERQALRKAKGKRRASRGDRAGQGLNPEAKRVRDRRARGNADAPRSGLRPDRR